MRKDRVARVAARARAATKEAPGKITGDKDLQAEGAAEKAAARLRPTSVTKTGQRVRFSKKIPTA